MSAQILAFQPRVRTQQRDAAEMQQLPSIIIFPGVRYERWGADEAETRSMAGVQPPLSAPLHC